MSTGERCPVTEARMPETILIGILVADPELGEAGDLPHPGHCAPHGKAYHR